MRSKKDSYSLTDDGTLFLNLNGGQYAYELVYMGLQKEIYLIDDSIAEYADKIKRVKIRYLAGRGASLPELTAEYKGVSFGTPDERFEKDLTPCIIINIGDLI